MSAPQEDDDLRPTATEGYKVGQQRTVEELAALDQEDESLQRWKASLGIAAGASSGGGAAGSGIGGPKKVIPKTLFLESPGSGLANRIELDLTQGPEALARLKKEPLTIKEGIEYSVGITFVVSGQLVSGLKYLQVVKRAGISVDKMEAMIGSYPPKPDAYTKVFAAEESPSGMLARSGSYVARSRIMDDDGQIWLDVEWGFKLAKEW